MKTAHDPASRSYMRGEYGHKRPFGKRQSARAARRAAARALKVR
jgi:hypothetical protein